MTHFDDGVRVKLYVSTAGDLVSLGTRTEYPFQAGGAGIPAGWTMWMEDANALITDVNWTTQNGRFSVSNASDTNAHNGKKYGIYRDFPVQSGHFYLVQVQAQVMEDKSPAYREVVYLYNGAGDRYGSSNHAVQGWEQISLPMTWTSGTTFIRVMLKANPYWARTADAQFDWGVQFQNFAMVDMLTSYPDPTWHEVTCDGLSATIRYGRSKFTSRYDVASCQLTMTNTDGDYTYNPNHELGLRPGRFVRVTIQAPGDETEYPLFYGLIDSLTDAYGLDGKAGVSIQCVDTSSLLSNINVASQGSESSTYKSGGRFYAVLRGIGWLDQMVSIETGVYTQQSIQASGRTVRDELGIIADSEGGFFFTDRIGRMVYKSRDAPANIPQWNTVQAELLAECPDYLERVKLEFPGVAGNGMQTEYQTYGSMFDCCAKVTMRDMNGPEQCFWSNGVNYFSKQAGTKNLVARVGNNTHISTVPLPYNDGDTFWLRFRKDYLYRGMFDHLPATESNEIPNVNTMIRLGATSTSMGATTPAPDEPINFGGFGATLDSRPLNARVWRIMWQLSPSNNPLVDIQPATMDGLAGALVVPLTVPYGSNATVKQTGSNVIVQPDPDRPTTSLVPVDNVPTSTTAAIVMLQNLVTDWSRDRVVNQVELANQGGSAFQFTDAESQRRYGPRTYQRLDFVNLNTYPEYLVQRAQDIMDGYTDAVLRVNQVDFRPNLDTYLWAIKVFLNDLVRVRYTNSRNGWGYSVASHIQQIQHTITPHDWQVSLLLDDAEAFNRWDEAANGMGWDEAIWDEGRWDGFETAQWNREAKWNDGVSVWK